MKKILLMGVLILGFSCMQEPVESISPQAKAVESSFKAEDAMHIKTLTVSLTKAE